MVYFPGPELDQHEDRKLREIFNALFDVYWKQYVKKKKDLYKLKSAFSSREDC